MHAFGLDNAAYISLHMFPFCTSTIHFIIVGERGGSGFFFFFCIEAGWGWGVSHFVMVGAGGVICGGKKQSDL